MINQEEQVWEPRHLAEQAYWRPLVQAAGLDSKAHDPFNTYMLASAIGGDHEVHMRSMGGGTWLQVVQAMTPAEIAALQQRIIKRWNAKVVACD